MMKVSKGPIQLTWAFLQVTLAAAAQHATPWGIPRTKAIIQHIMLSCDTFYRYLSFC